MKLSLQCGFWYVYLHRYSQGQHLLPFLYLSQTRAAHGFSLDSIVAACGNDHPGRTVGTPCQRDVLVSVCTIAVRSSYERDALTT